jgi:hypothetical protein
VAARDGAIGGAPLMILQKIHAAADIAVLNVRGLLRSDVMRVVVRQELEVAPSVGLGCGVAASFGASFAGLRHMAHTAAVY